MSGLRVGIDIGGTKTDAVAIAADGSVAHDLRLSTGFGDDAVLATAVAAVEELAHTAGVAVDLTLVDANKRDLDMGTGYDAFTPLSHHGVTTGISAEGQKNRLILLGIMTSAGWDFYRNEWWHYQLFNARDYPLLSDKDLPRPMMAPAR